MFIKVYVVLNLCSKMKFNKQSKETKYIKNHCDMLHGLTLNLASVIWCTVSSVTLVGYICPTTTPPCQILLKAVYRLLKFPVGCQVVKKISVLCHSDICSAAGGHSAGCRTSWVCLQHHATVVTFNGVTICSSHLPPTVSKHCQYQHSSIPKTILVIWNTNNPSCCDIQGAASSVQPHGSLYSQQQQPLLWCLFLSAKIQLP